MRKDQRSFASRRRSSSSKMVHGYAFYIILAIALASLGFFAPAISSPPTGQATAGAYEVTLNIPEPAQAPSQTSPTGTTAPAKPACAPGCGEPCWLVGSGEPPGSYESSGGSLGLLECAGLCWYVDAFENDCG